MGLLRLYLALSVLAAHSRKLITFPLVNATIAVHAFFVLCGFYISLILTEKYRGPGALFRFYRSRVLRLFPMYALAVALSLAVYGVCDLLGHPTSGAWTEWKNWGPKLSWTASLFSVGSNVTLLGQDLVMFLCLKGTPANLSWTSHFRDEAMPLYRLLILPPSWSLSLEITFYLLAPFLVRRSLSFLGVLALGSIASRLLLQSGGYQNDPWNYRFFPSELVFFLAGSLAYRAYAKWHSRFQGIALPISLTAMLVLTAFVAQDFLHVRTGSTLTGRAVFLSVVTAALPFLFSASKGSRWDLACAELTYPVYLIHWTIFSVLPEEALRRYDPRGVFTILLTIGLSMLMLRALRPVERLRARQAAEAPAETTRPSSRSAA